MIGVEKVSGVSPIPLVVVAVLPVVVLANGLAAGVLAGTQLGGWPLLVALPPGRYVHAHAFFATRYDPFMPVCLVGTVLGDLVLAVAFDHIVARALYLLAMLLALVTVAISIVKNVPVNKWIQTLDPERLPADFTARDPRPTWGRWNQIRARLTVTALLLNCIGLALALGMSAG